MPYYVSDSNPDCGGWAVEKQDGEVIGCHDTKQDAIDQMVAVSLSEGIEPGGERYKKDKDKDKKRQLPDNYRPATSADVPEGRACGNCVFFNETDVAPDGRARCDKWGEYVDGGAYCDAWQPRQEARQVSLNLPAYIRNAAEQGLRWHADGKSGSGIVPRTIREAREMANGNITEDKVIRVSAWAARHKTDLDATGAKPGQDGFPTPGAVAHYLWGIPTGTRYADAVAWFDRKAEQIKANRTSNSRIRILDLEGLARASRSAGWTAVATAQAQPTATPTTPDIQEDDNHA